MSQRIPPEVRQFIENHVKGTPIKELARMTSEATGYSFDTARMKSYMYRHGLTNGLPSGGGKRSAPSKVFPAEIQQYIADNHVGCGPAEMTRRLNDRFSRLYRVSQIKSFYQSHGLVSGVDGRFQPGHTPANKGIKGVHVPGCEKTWFRQNHMPKNTKPIGFERINMCGYTEVKVRMRPSRPGIDDNFAFKHRLIWENVHGPLSPNQVVIFKDGDRQNFDPENLLAVTKAEQMAMTRKGFFSKDASLTETGALVAKLDCQIRALEKSKKEKKA